MGKKDDPKKTGKNHSGMKGQHQSRTQTLPTLDLHGYTTDAVNDAVDRFLVKSQRAGHARIRLITGKGTGAVRKVALEWLKLGGFPYTAENEGSFVIFLGD